MKEWRKSMSSYNRWLIEGSLTTLTPLHIGNGDDIHIEIKGNSKKVSVDVAEVVTDEDNKPYITGSALKGVLRNSIPTDSNSDEIVNSIFGSGAGKEWKGGKVEFWDARLDQTILKKANYPHLPHWNNDRATAIKASASIDRDYQTAAERKLFYHEFVPAGLSFNVSISGKNLESKEVAFILHTLEGFNSRNTRLGANTGNDYGKLEWNFDYKQVRLLEGEKLLEWLENGGFGYEKLPEIDKNKIKEIEDIQAKIKTESEDSLLKIDIKLVFDGPFLSKVAIPKKFDKVSKDESSSENSEPDSIPLRNSSDKVYLPASSFRGSLRFQAEKILRTIGIRACYEGDIGGVCSPIYDKNDIGKLCLACQLFGGSGWKAPLSFSDFELVNEVEYKQEFGAIDRFTGGGAYGKKFNIKAVFTPTLKGCITIAKDRIKSWGWGLIALLLNDLQQGDISFGYGTTKGYGICSEIRLSFPKGQKEIIYNNDNIKSLLEQLKMNNKQEE